MKRLYALIAALGIEFGPATYARDHVFAEPSSVTELIDGCYDDEANVDRDGHYADCGAAYLGEECDDDGH